MSPTAALALAGKPLVVAACQPRGEVAAARLARARAHRLADEMRPQGDLGARKVAPQHVQALVPTVQLCIIGTLKAGAAESKGLQKVPVQRPDDVRSNVRAVGDVFTRIAFAVCRTPPPRYHGATRAENSGRCGGARERRPPASGRSNVSGL